MKRRLLAILIFLLAGAVVNVAVAWGCAAWSRARDVLRDEWVSVGLTRQVGFGIERLAIYVTEPDGVANLVSGDVGEHQHPFVEGVGSAEAAQLFAEDHGCVAMVDVARIEISLANLPTPGG